VIGPSFPDVPPAIQDTKAIFHFLHFATLSHLTAWQKGSNNSVAQSDLSQKRIPQFHCCESLKFASTYVIHCPSICPSVTPCVSKSNNPIEKLTKNSYSFYTGKLRTIVNADITSMAKNDLSGQSHLRCSVHSSGKNMTVSVPILIKGENQSLKNPKQVILLRHRDSLLDRGLEKPKHTREKFLF
jgi:hypothetical protein